MNPLPLLLAATDEASHGSLANAAIPVASEAPGLAWLGWVLALPAISACLCGLLAALRVRNKLPALLTVLALGTAFALILKLYLSRGPDAAPVIVHLWDWMNFSWGDGLWRSFQADVSLYIDSLTLLWMLFVTGLGTLIAVFASEYMEAERGPGYARFFFGVSIFLLAMSALVMADNLVLLYLGWEGVGLASYLLIGFYYQKPSAVAAAKKAFIMNRVGDLGLAVGIWLIWVNYGTVEYSALFQAFTEGGAAQGGWDRALIPFCLMLGAFGKSAQLPLFTWLPDAMEGPTPVSALIHAATMVTAGVYLIARMQPLFMLHPDAMATVAWIGGLTALLAATIGMAQHDIKRVFAYSTVSQLGYMFMGLGVGTAFGAAYHVFTHAFFKALLFLTAGAVMHGFAGQLDLRKLSGLRRVPGFGVVCWTMLLGSLALAAFPFTSGFLSKDLILVQAFSEPRFVALGWLGLATAGLTAYYTFRVWFRVCAGPVAYTPGEESHGHDDHGDHGDHGHGDHGAGFHPHAPRLAINGVLLLIAVGVLLSAVPGYMALRGEHNWVQEMVYHSTAVRAAGVAHVTTPVAFGLDPHGLVTVFGIGLGVGGILVALWLHLLDRRMADRLRTALRSNPLTGWLPTCMENKWYVDEIYDVAFRQAAWITSHLLHFFDRHLIDGLLVNGFGRLPMMLGRLFQPLYNGALQGYATTMAGGLILVLAWVAWRWLGAGGLA
ncbi:MAG: NADH-quinone oxidoreductase subunit [Planctomycetota bacterium]